MSNEATTRPPERGRHKRDVKHKFTQEEIVDLAKKLAQETATKIELENEKKSVVSSYKAKLDLAESSIVVLSNEITLGYKMERAECYTVFSMPESGKKSIFVSDTHELVAEELMTHDEKQQVMDFREDDISDVDGWLPVKGGDDIKGLPSGEQDLS